MKRLAVCSAILSLWAVAPCLASVGPASVGLISMPAQRVDDLVPTYNAPAPQQAGDSETEEPIAVPVPTALQAGMTVFAMAGVWRLARRIKLAA